MTDISISISTQTLTLHTTPAQHFVISSAKNGAGQLLGSECTPLGTHTICAKIGDGLPVGSVFVARQPTGELYNSELANAHPTRDWILTRILWLDGCEAGFNQGTTSAGDICDSKARYIYIHGTPNTEPMGIPCSHGCIRMRDDDLLTVFDAVQVGSLVTITL